MHRREGRTGKCSPKSTVACIANEHPSGRSVPAGRLGRQSPDPKGKTSGRRRAARCMSSQDALGPATVSVGGRALPQRRRGEVSSQSVIGPELLHIPWDLVILPEILGRRMVVRIEGAIDAVVCAKCRRGLHTVSSCWWTGKTASYLVRAPVVLPCTHISKEAYAVGQSGRCAVQDIDGQQ